jgi:hypothetical protein
LEKRPYLEGKSLIEARPQEVAIVSFEAGSIDIDTPEDYEPLR